MTTSNTWVTQAPPAEPLQSDEIVDVVAALVAAQQKFNPATRSSFNPQFKSKYTALDSVLDAVLEALNTNGIAVVQQTYIQGDKIILFTKLLHTSGQWLGSRYPLRPVKPDPQGDGSALTYARRYSLMALVGIAPEDDDGNAAVDAGRKQDEEPKRQQDTEKLTNPTGDLIRRIHEVGKAKGVTIDKIDAKFAEVVGTPIGKAKQNQLTGYLNYLVAQPGPSQTKEEPKAESAKVAEQLQAAKEAEAEKAAEALLTEKLGAEPIPEAATE